MERESIEQKEDKRMSEREKRAKYLATISFWFWVDQKTDQVLHVV